MLLFFREVFRNGAPAEPFRRSRAGHSIEAHRTPCASPDPLLPPSDPAAPSFPLATLPPRLQVPSAPGEPELEVAMDAPVTMPAPFAMAARDEAKHRDASDKQAVLQPASKYATTGEPKCCNGHNFLLLRTATAVTTLADAATALARCWNRHDFLLLRGGDRGDHAPTDAATRSR